MVIKDLKPRLKLELVINGHVVLDETGAMLLLLIDKTGSIMKASKLIGIPYSSAWEYISRIEKRLNIKVVEARRGGPAGGGAVLTYEGRRLLEKFLTEYQKFFGKTLSIRKPATEMIGGIIVYAGSHDIALEHVFGILRDRGFHVDVHWIGSLKGLASLLLEEATICGIHLYDEDTSSYNIPFVKKFLSGKAVLIRGYERLQGFVLRTVMSLREILVGLFNGKLKLVNRLYGSGTRLLLDHILSKKAIEFGIDPHEIPKRINGYLNEVWTHIDVARCIAQGEADVGVTIKWVAEMYGLHFIPLKWECFDFVVPKNIPKAYLNEFITSLRSRKFISIIRSMSGYRYNSKHIGTIVNV